MYHSDLSHQTLGCISPKGQRQIPLEISFANLELNSPLEILFFPLLIYHAKDLHFQLDPLRKTGLVRA